MPPSRKRTMTSEFHSQWADLVAARLRELQSSGTHLPAAKRSEYLRTELQKAVEELPVESRLAELERLGEQFPVEETPAAPTSSPDPDLVLAQLSEVLATLNGPDEESFASRVRALLGESPRQEASSEGGSSDLAGLLHVEPDQIPHLQLALTVLKSGKLEISSPQALELLNLVKTATLLVDSFSGIESVFWKIWSATVPKSHLQSPFAESFLADTASLLEGHPEASFAGYSRSVSQTSRLLVAVLSSIPTALDRLADAWLNRFAPERIAAEVRRAERGPLGGQPEQRFWREFEYRSADFTPAQLAESFLHYLADSAVSMIDSPRSTPS